MSLLVTSRRFDNKGWHACVWDTDDDTFKFVHSIELEKAIHNGITIDNFDFGNWNIVTWRHFLKGKLFEFNKYPIKILSSRNILVIWFNGDVFMFKVLVDFNFEFYIDTPEKVFTVIIDIFYDRMSIHLGLSDGSWELGERELVISRHLKAS